LVISCAKTHVASQSKCAEAPWWYIAKEEEYVLTTEHYLQRPIYEHI
jgi:hypothetical protein